jgi:hypothetical protein
MAGRKRKTDAALVVALACGASAEGAAQKAGVSLRTVYRRLAEPDFRAQVEEARTEMTARAVGMLSAASLASVKTFVTLQESAASEAVRLGAARSVIELGCKLRESVELARRMAALEARLVTLLGEVLEAAHGQGVGTQGSD